MRCWSRLALLRAVPSQGQLPGTAQAKGHPQVSLPGVFVRPKPKPSRDIRIFRYLDIQIFGYSDIWIFGYLDIRIFGYSDIRIFGYLDIRIFGYLDIRIVGIRIFRYSDICCLH
ncbi:hypothetical protein TURU_154663 [Turdus rufiventris]|nr:hypothetical protein TURU_154663 [Turdus rufiventris]